MKKQIETFKNTQGSLIEKLDAAGKVGTLSERAHVLTLGFSDAPDRVQHLKDITGAASAERAGQHYGEAAAEGDVNKALKATGELSESFVQLGALAEGGRGIGKLFSRDAAAQAVAGSEGTIPVETRITPQAGITAEGADGGVGIGYNVVGRGAEAAPSETGRPLRRVFRDAESAGVEPASSELLQAVQNKDRAVLIAEEGSEELRYLDTIGAEANVGCEANTHILLRQNPSKVGVLEEFLHGTQMRLGIIQRLDTAGAEYHVKDFMIRHSRLLKIGAEDARRLEILRDADQASLSRGAQ